MAGDDYSGGPTTRGIEESYQRAAKKGSAVPADERSGSVLGGEVYSTKKEYSKQGAAARGMRKGFAQSKQADAKDMKIGADALAKRDEGLVKDMKKRGADRLTVGGFKNSW